MVPVLEMAMVWLSIREQKSGGVFGRKIVKIMSRFQAVPTFMVQNGWILGDQGHPFLGTLSQRHS